MFKLIAAVAIAAAAVPATASVHVYDAFSSFTGTNTGGAFTYGVLNGFSASFTAYNDTPGCAALISDVICTSNGFLPAAFKSTTGAHQSGSVIVPGDALIFHPGPNAGESAAILFTAPKTGTTTISFSAFVADTNPSGVNLIIFAPGLIAVPIATLSAANPTFSFNDRSFGVLPAGFQLGFAVDYDGSYNNDSTGFNLTISQVPEPATWGLMIAGFGLVGVSLRRKAALAA